MRSPTSKLEAGQLTRLVAGLAISISLTLVVVSRVDLGAVAHTLTSASLGLLAPGVALNLLDQTIRAFRWSRLLAPLRTVRLGEAIRFQAIGYLANAILPARLGDVGRAYLTAWALDIPRIATMATIIAERVLDGVAMLGLALVSSMAVPRAGSIRELAIYSMGLVGIGALIASVGWMALSHGALSATRLGVLTRSLRARIGSGLVSLRNVRGGSSIFGITIAAELLD